MSDKENMYEVYFEWWLEELQKKGLVKSWVKEPEQLLVLQPSIIYSKVHFVRKEPRIVTHNLCNSASYTYDFCVEIHKSLLDKFVGYLVPDEKNTFILTELYERQKGDTFYDFSYYYIHNDDIAKDYVKVYFDVKPPSSALRFASALTSAREFPYNQKLMLERYGIFVNKVIPIGSKDALYNKSFVPARYFLTDGGSRERKINPKNVKEVRTIDTWMKSLNLKPIANVFTED